MVLLNGVRKLYTAEGTCWEIGIKCQDDSAGEIHNAVIVL